MVRSVRPRGRCGGAAGAGMSEFLTVHGRTVRHNTIAWRVATNRHPETNGRSWGWIEGAPDNVCWADSESFNRAAAGEMVKAHNAWLESQKPLDLRLLEARYRAESAQRVVDGAEQSLNLAIERRDAANAAVALLLGEME